MCSVLVLITMLLLQFPAKKNCNNIKIHKREGDFVDTFGSNNNPILIPCTGSCPIVIDLRSLSHRIAEEVIRVKKPIVCRLRS